MSLFYTNSEKNHSVFAPMSGEIFPLSDSEDRDISDGLLGEGFLVLPKNETLFSPADGIITNINNSLDSYSILTDYGADILIKLGTGTEKILGEGIRLLVDMGMRVKVGSPLCCWKSDILTAEGISLLSPVVIRNCDDFSAITVFEGKCTAAVTEAMTFI